MAAWRNLYALLLISSMTRVSLYVSAWGRFGFAKYKVTNIGRNLASRWRPSHSELSGYIAREPRSCQRGDPEANAKIIVLSALFSFKLLAICSSTAITHCTLPLGYSMTLKLEIAYNAAHPQREYLRSLSEKRVSIPDEATHLPDRKR